MILNCIFHCFTAAFTHVPNLTGSVAAVDSSVVGAAEHQSSSYKVPLTKNQPSCPVAPRRAQTPDLQLLDLMVNLRTSLKLVQFRVRWTEETFEIMFADVAWSLDLKRPTISRPSISLPIFHQSSIHLFSQHPNIEPSKNQPPSLIHPRTHLTILSQSSPLLVLRACSSFPLSTVK